MSLLNNRDTLAHCLGKVWLTRPAPFPAGGDERQGINVCVEQDGGFTAIDHLQLAPDGVYYKKNEAIGKLGDERFRRYIEKLAGADGMGERDLFEEVCALYGKLGDMAGVAKALGLTTGRVQRILITRGLYTSDLVKQIEWLHDGGRGMAVGEMAALLKVSEETVKRNMAYGR